MADFTYYPDVHPEVTSVDGYVTSHNFGGVTWDVIHDAEAGTGADNDVLIFVGIQNDVAENKLQDLHRAFCLFDISALRSTAIITTAKLGIRVAGKTNTLLGSPTLNVFSSNPASNTNLVIEDYDQLGITPLATALTYANVVADSVTWNEFTLNAAGLTIVTAALAGDGIVKLGVREATYDAPDVVPPWTSGTYVVFEFLAVASGLAFRLVITATDMAVRTDAATNITPNSATLNGTLTEDAGDTPVQCSFQWGLTTNYGNNTLAETVIEGNSFSKVIGVNLASGITYHYRAKAVGASGDIVYGDDKTFGTAIPAEALARVTGLVHWWSAGPTPIYQLEIALGGLSSQYFSPIGLNEPTPTIPAAEYEPTLADYYNWLNSFASYEPIIRIFGHMPSFQEWSTWYKWRLKAGF